MPDLVLRDGWGKSRRSARGIKDLAGHLVLRVPAEESAHSQKKFSTLGLELVLREIPGKSVERWWRPRRRQLRARLLRRRPLLDPPRAVVLRVPRSPRLPRRRPPRRLALRPRARPLPITNSRVRREPPPALPTRTLLGRHGGHRRLPGGRPYLTAAAAAAFSPSVRRVTSREQARVNSGERRSPEERAAAGSPNWPPMTGPERFALPLAPPALRRLPASDFGPAGGASSRRGAAKEGGGAACHRPRSTTGSPSARGEESRPRSSP